MGATSLLMMDEESRFFFRLDIIFFYLHAFVRQPSTPGARTRFSTQVAGGTINVLTNFSAELGMGESWPHKHARLYFTQHTSLEATRCQLTHTFVIPVDIPPGDLMGTRTPQGEIAKGTGGKDFFFSGDAISTRGEIKALSFFQRKNNGIGVSFDRETFRESGKLFPRLIAHSLIPSQCSVSLPRRSPIPKSIAVSVRGHAPHHVQSTWRREQGGD